MEWDLSWGSQIKFLRQQEIKTGVTPQALLSRPILSQYEQLYYDAFFELNGSRQWTIGGPSSIPLSEIETYFRIHHVEEEEEQAEYISIFQAMDDVFIKHFTKSTPKAGK